MTARFLAETVKPLLPLCQAEGLRRGSENAAYECCVQALQIVDDLQLALTSSSGWMPDGHEGVLWRHNDKFPDFRKVGFDSLGVSRPALEQVAAAYLALPWLSNGHLDWVIVDALARLELVAFDYAVEGEKFDITAFTTSPAVKWLLAGGLARSVEAVIAVAVIWWLWREYSTEAPYRNLWLAAATAYYGICAYMWVRAARVRKPLLRQRIEAMEKVAAAKILLRKTYWELKGPVLHPTRVREAFRDAETGGVSWPSPVWSIFQAAIDRNPGVWLTGYKEA